MSVAEDSKVLRYVVGPHPGVCFNSPAAPAVREHVIAGAYVRVMESREPLLVRLTVAATVCIRLTVETLAEEAVREAVTEL